MVIIANGRVISGTARGITRTLSILSLDEGTLADYKRAVHDRAWYYRRVKIPLKPDIEFLLSLAALGEITILSQGE